MTLIQEVFDGLKLVSDGIDSVKNIADAVKSGKDYVKNKHPEIKDDLRAMLAELSKSLGVVKQSSAVLTNFRFAVSNDVSGLELTRFNNYFIQSKSEAQHLREHINDLRTHCSKIRDHASKITDSTTAEGFAKIFTRLGLNSPARERELGQQLDKLAFEDFALANSAERMLTTLELALKDVQNTLGSGGAMYPENIPAAAALLAEYGPGFEKMEDKASDAIKEIRGLVSDLQ